VHHYCERPVWEFGTIPETVVENESGLFHYAIEFIQDRFFIQIIIQEKTERGLDTAILFARHTAKRIP